MAQYSNGVVKESHVLCCPEYMSFVLKVLLYLQHQNTESFMEGAGHRSPRSLSQLLYSVPLSLRSMARAVSCDSLKLQTQLKTENLLVFIVF